jgi:hypothetical protein
MEASRTTGRRRAMRRKGFISLVLLQEKDSIAGSGVSGVSRVGGVGGARALTA